MKFHFIISLIITSILATGCTPKSNIIILMPDDRTGEVGELKLTNNEGSVKLNKEGETLLIGNDQSMEIKPNGITDEARETLFSLALEMTPEVPSSYLIYFDFDSSNLIHDSQVTLKEILKTITVKNSKDILVIGHTDRAGEKAYNLDLSLKRARQIHDLLIDKGIEESSITILTHGEGNPLIPTQDSKAEPLNRRVEVLIR